MQMNFCTFIRKLKSIITVLFCLSLPLIGADKKPLTKEESAKVNSIFNTEEILDENTLETKTLQDWHPVGATRQKLIEINVAQWWPGQDYRIPVRLIVPLEGKAKGFSITGANPYETLMKDARPTDFQAKLLAGGVGIVKTFVKALRQAQELRHLHAFRGVSGTLCVVGN